MSETKSPVNQVKPIGQLTGEVQKNTEAVKSLATVIGDDAAANELIAEATERVGSKVDDNTEAVKQLATVVVQQAVSRREQT